jgi:hypothetical protein
LRTFSVVAILVVSWAFYYVNQVAFHRLSLLSVEVPRIINYVETYKKTYCKYPDGLSGYVFAHPEIDSFVRYDKPGVSRPGVDPYSIYYHPTHDEGIGHWYHPTTGFYYEDD